jgi:hypothetical protein
MSARGTRLALAVGLLLCLALATGWAATAPKLSTLSGQHYLVGGSGVGLCCSGDQSNDCPGNVFCVDNYRTCIVYYDPIHRCKDGENESCDWPGCDRTYFDENCV